MFANVHRSSNHKAVDPKSALGSAARIVERLMRGYEGGAEVRIGELRRQVGRLPPTFALQVQDVSVLRELIMHPDPIHLADAYFRGAIEIEGDFFQALTLKSHFERLALDWRDKVALAIDALRLPGAGSSDRTESFARRVARSFSHTHTKSTDQAAIAFHYDVSNEFYQLWLDEQMVYSCAYFTRWDESLENAQRNKLDHICRKLRLNPGERLLDVGCGWGALVCWAAKNYGVTAHGITLSRRQLEYARARVLAEGLEKQVTVELCDYRDLPAENCYDKVSSIGMFEHVGLANMAAYIASVRRVLKPGGLFLNHGITHDEDGWNKTLASEFINRYVFPDGELDRVSNIQLGMERGGFEILDVEALRPHYAITLRHWASRLEARKDAAIREVDEPTYRIWHLYLAACALEFESGGTGIYQILASKPDSGRWPVPLTRADLYPSTELAHSAQVDSMGG